MFLNLLIMMLTSAPGALFKDSKRRNNFIKKSKISISDALITHVFMTSYHLKALTSAPGALVNISLNFNY
jgi:hypothetical protein